jgi:DNA-binding NarL/FixJ family response regulator
MDEFARIEIQRASDPLTPRQKQVVRLLAQGYTNDEIATELKISTKTVEAHVARSKQRLVVSRRVDLARLTKNLVRPEPEPEPKINDRPRLTWQEERVIRLVHAGLRDRLIDAVLGVKEGVVRKVYLPKIYEKLGVNRLELAEWYEAREIDEEEKSRLAYDMRRAVILEIRRHVAKGEMTEEMARDLTEGAAKMEEDLRDMARAKRAQLCRDLCLELGLETGSPWSEIEYVWRKRLEENDSRLIVKHGTTDLPYSFRMRPKD